MRKWKGKNIKLDLEKAYDRLNWGCIKETLEDVDLPHRFTKIIMCILSIGSAFARRRIREAWVSGWPGRLTRPLLLKKGGSSLIADMICGWKLFRLNINVGGILFLKLIPGSNFWKGVCKAWKDVSPHLAWRVGTGRAINLWEDVWLGDRTKFGEVVLRPLAGNEAFL